MRNRINTYTHNNTVNNRIQTREQMIKEKFAGMQGAELEEAVNKTLAMRHILDTEFKKNFFSFTNNTKVLGAKSVNSGIEKFAELNGAETAYNAIRPFFQGVANLSGHLKKVQPGEELIKNAIEINSLNYSTMKTKASMSVPGIQKAYENFKNVNEFFVFDTETLSGMGKTGYNELDMLQELSFRKFKKVSGGVEEIAEEQMETLIGLSAAQAEHYTDLLITDYQKKGFDGINKNSVIAKRFALLGHKDTTLDFDAGFGLVTTKTFASDESKDLMSIENIKRGIERARQIGKKQEQDILDNGLKVWEDQLLRSTKIFNENFVAGYNSTNFDFEKMNQEVSKLWSRMSDVQKNSYTKMLGLKSGAVPTINPTQGMYLDLRDPVRIAAQYAGKTGLYDLEGLETIKGMGKTLLQQESFGEVYAKSAKLTAAHTAGADVTILANLLAGDSGTGESLLDRMMNIINTSHTEYSGTIDKTSVLMGTQIENFNDYTRKGALNFTVDRSTGAIRTFNGYSLEADGTVKNLGKYGNATGIKKDVAYQISHMGEFDVDEKFIDAIKGYHQDYAQGKFWSVTLNPLMDSKIAGNNEILSDPITYMFTSKESMEGFVSSHLRHVGDNVGGKLMPLKDAAARAQVERDYGIRTVVDGKLSDAVTPTIEDLVSNGTHKAMNDAAGRAIRENEYSKAIKFRKLQDYFIEKGYSTVEEQKHQLSLATAESVSKGQVQQIKHDVLQILGHSTKKDPQQKLFRSTLNNTINGYEYMASQRHIIDQVISAVNEYGKDISSEQKQYIYNTLMNGIHADAEAAFSETLGSANQVLNLYNKDLNYFEFDMPKGYFKNTNAKAMSGEIDNVLRVNLEPEKEFSLVNELLRRRKGDDRILNNPTLREVYGKQEILDFMNTVNKMEGYEGIFDEMLNGKEAANIKNLIASKKYEKSLIRDELYADFDKVLAENIDTDQAVIDARKGLEELKAKRKALRKEISSNVKEGKSYQDRLQELFGIIDDSILPKEEWNDLSKAEKEDIKRYQAPFIKERDDILDLFNNTELHNEIDELEKKIDEQYKVIFAAQDASRADTRKQYKEWFQERKTAKNSEIDELYDQLNEKFEKTFATADISADALAERVQVTLREYKKINPAAGFSKTREYQDYTKAYKFAEAIDTDFIKASIDNSKKGLADLKIIDTYNAGELKQEVEKLVDEVLMPKVKGKNGSMISNIEEIAQHAQEMFGYNKETAKLFKHNLELQREAHIKGMGNLVKAVTEAGGLVSYDVKKGDIGITFGNESYNLFGLAKTRIENGVLHTKLGNQRFAAGLKVDAEVGDIVSNLSSAYENFDYLAKNIERAIKRGESPAQAVIRSIGRFSNEVRELSTIGNMTIKDTYSWQTVDTKDVLYKIPDYLNKMKAYDGWEDKEMLDIFEKNKDSLKKGKVTSEVIEAYTKNRQDIMKIMFGIGAGQENKKLSRRDYILGNLSSYVKDSKLSKGVYHSGEYGAGALLEFDNPSRPPINSADGFMYNKEKLDKAIEANGKLKGRISTKNRLTTKRQSAGRVIDGVGETVSSVSFQSASLSEKHFKEILHEHFIEDGKIKGSSAKEREWNEAVFKQMKALNLTEQGRIIDGYIADEMLAKTETQIIGAYKNFARDLELTNEVMAKRINKAMPTITAVDGSIVFELGKKDYVKRGDALFSIEGFGGVEDIIGAKEDAGFFGFRYTSKGTNMEIEKDVLQDFLNKNKKDILDKDGKVNVTKALELLDTAFDSQFYVENAFQKGYNKTTTELAEKGMAEALLSGAGTIDKRIDNVLKRTGLDDARGKILGKEFIEEVLLAEFSGLSEEERTKLGFAGGNVEAKEALKKAVLKEKFAMSDEIRRISQLEDVSMISVDNIPKHGNLGTGMKQFINNIAEKQRLDSIKDGKEISMDEAYERTEKILKDAGVFSGVDFEYKNGSIEFGEIKDAPNAIINQKAVSELNKKLGIYTEGSPFAIMQGKELVGFKTTSSVMFNEDFSGTSRSQQAYINKLRDDIASKREALREMDKDDISYKALKDKINIMEQNMNVASKYNKTMKISSREVDMLSLYDYDDKKMVGLKNKLGDENFEKIYGSMLNESGALNDEHRGRKMYRQFVSDIEDRAYQQALDSKDDFVNTRAALKFNIDPSGHIDELKDMGFEVKSIDELVVPYGENTKFLLDDPNSSLGKNLIIDTGVGKEGSAERYIAISKNDYALTGETVATDEVQKALSSLQRAKTNLMRGIEGDKGVLTNGTTIETLETRVVNAAQEVKEAMVGNVQKTLEGLDTVKLGGYSYNKASMAMIDTGDLKDLTDGVFKGSKSYHMYNVSEINGKTIGQWASEGVHYDASWQGRQYFKDLGYYDEKVWKDQLGFESISELEDHLSKYGTMGVELRTPTIKEGSVSISHQFLDVGLKDGMSKATATMTLARNQDHDGDSVIMAQLAKKDNNGKEWTKVKYDVQMRKNPSLVPEEIKSYYGELNADTTTRAATINNKIFDDIATDLYDEGSPNVAKGIAIDDVMMSKKVNLNPNGEMMAFHQTDVDSAHKNAMYEKYNELRSAAMERLGKDSDEFDAMDSLKQSKEIRRQLTDLSEDAQKIYKAAIDFIEVQQKTAAAEMSKTGKAAIGFINTPLASLRRYASAEGFSSEQRQHIQALADIFEEGVISRKHSTDTKLSLAQTFRDYVTDMVKGKSSGAEGIISLMDQYYEDDIYNKLQTYSDLEGLSKDEMMGKVKQTVLDISETFQKDNKTAQRIWAAQDMQRNLGKDGSKLDTLLATITEDFTTVNGRAMAKAGYNDSTSYARKAFVDSDGFESKAMKSGITKAVTEVAANMDGAGIGGAIAKGALGLAAAVMMTGYIGGNPTKPAETHAQEMDSYDSLQDKDLSIQQLPQPQGTGQGYVININAQTQKGQDHAMQAIQKAMYSSVPTDINIAMNIKDKTSNIDSRFVEKLLTRAL